MYKNSNEYTDEVISKFPHQYSIEEESNNYFLLKTYLEELQEINKALYDLINALNIQTSTGYLLDRFGSIFDVVRLNNEKDDSYRPRIVSKIVSNSKNATADTILSVLGLLIDDLDNNLFIFDEGIYPDYSITDGEQPKYYELFEGYLGSSQRKIGIKKSGGVIYFVLNKALPYELKETITDMLLQVKAAGIKIFVEFKYKLQIGNYACGISQVGTIIHLNIVDGLFDGIEQEKSIETNITKFNVTGKEGVR